MAKTPPSDASDAVAPPDPAAKTEDVPVTGADLKAAQMALKESGTYEFAAPGFMGGSRITLAKGERVPPHIWNLIPEADRELFESYTPPAPTGEKA